VFNFPVYKRCKSKLHLYFISPQLEWPYSRAITTNAGEIAAKQEPSYTVGGYANGHTMESNMKISQKAKDRIAM
jgi:hypothetical protein